MTNKILLVLDIDETLIHATPKLLNRENDFKVFNYYIYCRPYLNDFINTIKDDFLIAIWSSASDDYVKKVVKCIFPKDITLQFVWGRSRCTYKRDRELQIDNYGNYESHFLDHYHYTKPLKKLKRKGFKLNKILIIDDTPYKCSNNYGNAIYPKEFLGDSQDNELKKLAQYLKTLKDAPNVRTIEKRGWNTKF
jgi:RNA polymerase II subunit A small phosphatase-like protein